MYIFTKISVSHEGYPRSYCSTYLSYSGCSNRQSKAFNCKYCIQWTTHKLMLLGGPKLASTHPKINLSVWKYKDKEGLRFGKRINRTLSTVKSIYQSSIHVECTVVGCVWVMNSRYIQCLLSLYTSLVVYLPCSPFKPWDHRLIPEGKILLWLLTCIKKALTTLLLSNSRIALRPWVLESARSFVVCCRIMMASSSFLLYFSASPSFPKSSGQGITHNPSW